MKTKYLDLFEKFSNGEMTSEEASSFEQQLKDDAEMAAAYQEYGQILEALDDKETLSLMAKLREIREEESKKGGRHRFLNTGNNWIWLAALLTIVVSFTIIVSMLIYNYTTNRKNTKLTAAAMEEKARANLNAELMKYGMRTHGMTLEEPSDSSSFIVKGDIFFKWTVDSTYNLLMDVLDDEGKIVFKSHRPIESPFVFRKKLKEGIYIFRFRDDKETFNVIALYLI